METKYDRIGSDYNLTRKADPYLTQKLLQHLDPKKGNLYLDVGCGTGNYTYEFQERGYHFIGIDPSEKMLKKAKVKNPEADWRLGTAENTGLPDNVVDGIMGSLTIHHWTDLKRAFSELSRILKPQGKLVLFTSTPHQMKGYWLNHYFPKMMLQSIMQMPALKLIETTMNTSGIEIVRTEKYFIQPNLQDHFLYCGKQNPKLYLDDQIRLGISSFSSLANHKEVEQGLSELREDINTGRIDGIVESYQNDLGDYLYIVGKIK